MNREFIREITGDAREFTTDSLLEIAIRCEEYRGDYHYDAYDLKSDALHCAEYMERNAIANLTHIGPFDNRAMGDTAIIPKGALVVCSGVNKNYDAKKTYSVKVWNWSPGYVRHKNGFDGHIEIHDTKVTWLSDGYYKDSYDWKEAK